MTTYGVCGVQACHLPEFLNHCEGCPRRPGYRDMSEKEVIELCSKLDRHEPQKEIQVAQ